MRFSSCFTNFCSSSMRSSCSETWLCESCAWTIDAADSARAATVKHNAIRTLFTFLVSSDLTRAIFGFFDLHAACFL